jgi:prepilin-type N-terminal cleavage/methylation domain-containing protein
MSRIHRPGRDNRGFTLLEVMAALSVFLIGITSVLALLSAGTTLHAESQSLGVTSDAAEAILLLGEREAAERAPHLQGALPESPDPRPVPGRPDLQYRWSVRAEAERKLHLLSVEVNWLHGGKVRSLVLERVLPRLQSAIVDARRILDESKH